MVLFPSLGDEEVINIFFKFDFWWCLLFGGSVSISVERLHQVVSLFAWQYVAFKKTSVELILQSFSEYKA